MKLQDLRSAWNQYSTTDADRHRLNETDLHQMLRKRTLGLIGRIDRNISIGFIAFTLLSFLFILDDFVFSPLLPEGDSVPFWIILIDGLSVLIVLGTFVYFSICYSNAKKDYSCTNDLKHVLRSIIHILNTYRRLFHWALGILLLVLGVAFFTGLLAGVEAAAFRQQVAVEDLNQSQLIRQMTKGMVILMVLIGILFFFFRWGFRKLYGRYIAQMEETLNELDEIE